jgi:hypothetical protein
MVRGPPPVTERFDVVFADPGPLGLGLVELEEWGAGGGRRMLVVEKISPEAASRHRQLRLGLIAEAVNGIPFNGSLREPVVAEQLGQRPATITFVAEGAAPGAVIREGAVRKSSGGKKLEDGTPKYKAPRKETWKQRWLVLSHPQVGESACTLRYYKDEKSYRAGKPSLGEIALAGGCNVLESAEGAEAEGAAEGCGFTVVSRLRDFICTCTAADEASGWVAEVRSRAPGMGTAPPTAAAAAFSDGVPPPPPPSGVEAVLPPPGGPPPSAASTFNDEAPPPPPPGSPSASAGHSLSDYEEGRRAALGMLGGGGGAAATDGSDYEAGRRAALQVGSALGEGAVADGGGSGSGGGGAAAALRWKAAGGGAMRAAAAAPTLSSTVGAVMKTPGSILREGAVRKSSGGKKNPDGTPKKVKKESWKMRWLVLTNPPAAEDGSQGHNGACTLRYYKDQASYRVGKPALGELVMDPHQGCSVHATTHRQPGEPALPGFTVTAPERDFLCTCGTVARCGGRCVLFGGHFD